ncbi:MAG: DUF1614 domain-containing protein [Halanaerobium sp.]|nr:DUF1614 domain-containing protein [Halanaerobium sp.]
MSLGLIVLVAVGFLAFFGLADRVLDKLYLSDRTALIFIALLIGGSFIDIPVSSSPRVIINVGGAIIPVGLAIYVLFHAGSRKEWVRTILAIIATGIAINGASYLMSDFGHGRNDLIDPSYVFIILAGFIAYIFGRSRRGAFIAGTLGYLINDLIHLGRVLTTNMPGITHFGGAGAFDTMVLTGVFSVVLVELVGESRERLAGGSKTEVRERRLLQHRDDEERGDEE